MLNDPEHSENYWLSGALENERLNCHFCVGSLQAHEENKHDVQIPPKKHKSKVRSRDELQDYIVMYWDTS